MTNDTKQKIISILNELILYCEEKNKETMKDVYKSVKIDLIEKKILSNEARYLCVYFRRYLNHADPFDYEDLRVQKLINFFENWE